MLWNFSIVKEDCYYFGEMNDSTAHGIGMFINEEGIYFIGKWNQGELECVYNSTGKIQIPEGDYSIKNSEILYRKLKVFNEIRDFEWFKGTEELFFNLQESKCHLNQSNPSLEYKVRLYQFTELQGIFQTIKHINILFRLNVEPQMISTYFMLVNFYSTRPEFFLFTSFYEDPWALRQSLSQIDRGVAYSNLLTSLAQLHSRKISPNNICPNSIAAIKDNNGRIVFVFNDFSKAHICKSKTADIKSEVIPCLLTRSKSFRPPESFKRSNYNPFRGDIFSLVLTICAFENGDEGLGEFTHERVDELPHIIKDFGWFMSQNTIKKCLDKNPANRLEVKQLISNKTTEL